MATEKELKTIPPDDPKKAGADKSDLSKEDKPCMLLLVGMPCCGKSTYISQNIDPNEFEILSVDGHIDDEVKRRKDNGEAATYRSIWDEFHPIAKQKYQENLIKALAARKNIIIDRNNLTEASRSECVALALEHGYRVEALVFEKPDEALYTELLTKRGERTGKIIYPEVIREREQSFIMPTDAEGFSKIETVDVFKDKRADHHTAPRDTTSDTAPDECDQNRKRATHQDNLLFASQSREKKPLFDIAQGDKNKKDHAEMVRMIKKTPHRR